MSTERESQEQVSSAGSVGYNATNWENGMQPHEILEELSHMGYAPTLLYDDNGHWLVTDTSTQPLCGGPGAYTSFVNDEQWYENIALAVDAYLEETKVAL